MVQDLERHHDAPVGRQRRESVERVRGEVDEIGKEHDDGAAPRFAGDRAERALDAPPASTPRSPAASTDSSAPSTRSKASRPAIAGSERAPFPPIYSSPTGSPLATATRASAAAMSAA